jgi:hypothetical protein
VINLGLRGRNGLLTGAVHDTNSTLEHRRSGKGKAGVRQRDFGERLDMSLVERGKVYRAFVGFKPITMNEVLQDVMPFSLLRIC